MLIVFSVCSQGQRLGAVFFGKLCGTAPAQKGKSCGQVAGAVNFCKMFVIFERGVLSNLVSCGGAVVRASDC